MKTIIAGSRDFYDYDKMLETLARVPWPITEVISGNAKGADQMGEWWAQEREIPVRVFPANWAQHGKAAGHIRNQEMAKVGDCLVAFWDGKSPGTKSIIEYALKRNLQTIVEYI